MLYFRVSDICMWVRFNYSFWSLRILKKLISFLRIVNIKQQQLIKCPPLTRTMFSIHDLGFREGGAPWLTI